MLDSVSALSEFYHAIGCNQKVFDAKINVKMKKGNKELFSKDIPIRVVYDSMTTKIDMLWDEAGYEDFLAMKLSGIYHAGKEGTTMTFIKSKKLLRISKKGSDKLVEIEA